MKLLLFGAEASSLRDAVKPFSTLEVVDEDPDVVVCYGGDGTVLFAEQRWPGVPKLPIRNSRRGNRLIPHAPEEIFDRLAQDHLNTTEFTKLECSAHRPGNSVDTTALLAMNEFNVHMGHVNSAVRFKLWVGDEAYNKGVEIIGDGLVISTPFGSTAYFQQITRGIFHVGLGIAFKNASEHTSHLIVSEEAEVRVQITRGPAGLAWDNAAQHVDLVDDDELIVRRHEQPALIYTWDPMPHPSDEF